MLEMHADASREACAAMDVSDVRCRIPASVLQRTAAPPSRGVSGISSFREGDFSVMLEDRLGASTCQQDAGSMPICPLAAAAGRLLFIPSPLRDCWPPPFSSLRAANGARNRALPSKACSLQS